jgi:hypothetical protein
MVVVVACIFVGSYPLRVPTLLLEAQPSVVVRSIVAVAWITDADAYGKLLCVSLRRYSQRDRTGE